MSALKPARELVAEWLDAPGRGERDDVRPNQQLDAALDLAKRFGPIFPTQAKRPLTSHGSRDASRDSSIIKSWWRRWPGAEITLLTGDPSRTVFADIDIKNGVNGLDSLEEMFGITANPVTPTMHTPSGGIHWAFAWPGYFVRSTTIAPGVEIKGDNAWITMPPGPGRFVDPHLTLDVPLAPLPEWAMPKAETVSRQVDAKPQGGNLSRYGERALDGAVKRITSAPAGEQEVNLNSECFSIGSLVAGGEIPAGLALDSLLWAARRMPSHDRGRPWRTTEVERKVRKAFTDGQREPRAVRHG